MTGPAALERSAVSRDWFERGLEHARARRFAAARRAFRRAIHHGARAPWACQELVRSYIATGRVAEGERVLREVLEPGSALLHHAIGYLYRRSGRAAQAREELEVAARARPTFWPARNELGWLEHRAGRTAEAVRMLRSAARHFASRSDSWGEATALTHLAMIARECFRLSEALDLLGRATALKRSCGDHVGLATVIHARAQVHHFRSEPLAAIGAYREALAIQQAIGFSEGIAASLNGLAIAQVDVGQHAEALSSLRAALRIYRRLGPSFTAHQQAALVNISAIHELAGDLRAVTRTMARALALPAESTGTGEARAIGIIRLGRALVLRGRPREALAVVGREDAGAGASATTRLWTALLRADCHLALGEPERALETARAALRRRQPDTSSSTLAVERERVRAVLGRAAVASGRTRAGLRHLREAKSTIDGIVSAQASRDVRMGLTDRLREVEDALVLALARESGASPRHAWMASAHCKARELVARSRSDDDSHRLERIEDEIRAVMTAGEPSADPARRLAELKQRYRAALDEVAPSAPRTCDGGAESHGRAPSLPAGVAAVEYHSCAGTTLAFTLQGERTMVTDLRIPRHELVRMVATLLQPLRAASREADAAPALLAFDARLAHRLYRKIVAPALRALDPPVQRLVVVPDGPLHDLPFGLLVTHLASSSCPDPFAWYGAHDYLASTISLSQRPAWSAPRRTAPRPAGRRALVLAHSPARPAVLQVEDGQRTVGPLPALEREVAAVGRALPDARILSGSAATPRAYCELATAADAIHVAAHAFCDAGIPDLSGLVLAGDGKGIDLLTARRIASVPLVASLVTLSSCETALGRTWHREGTLGLARAFHEAGARQVLASPWPVEDQAGATLLSAFHEGWGGHRDTSAALRRGQDAVRALGGRNVHPYFWASFILSESSSSPQAVG